VDGNEFNAEALILPCWYKGTIKIRGELREWRVYAGGAGYLYDGKSVNKRYLCRKNCCDAIKNLHDNPYQRPIPSNIPRYSPHVVCRGASVRSGERVSCIETSAKS
jgi:hypothetical protein